MKVLRVISSMDPSTGGPCQGVRNSIPELEHFSVYTEVVSLDNNNASFVKDEDFTINALGVPVSPWKYNKFLYNWLVDNVSRFDVIIVQVLWLYHSYAVYKVIKSLKLQNKYSPKVFLMPHGMLDPYFQKSEGRKLKAIRNSLYWYFIERSVVNASDGLLFTCQSELELARSTFPNYLPKNEFNVGYGVPNPPKISNDLLGSFYKKCEGLNSPYFLFLSRIHEKKGVDNLLSAYIEILNSHNDVPALVIAGPGLDTEYGQMILSKAYNFKHKIFFPGMLKGDAKWGAFYGCEAFILPSHQENFGIAVAEALACKKPVLISKQVNIWREIIDCGGGLVNEDTQNGTLNLFTDWLSLTSVEKENYSNNAYMAYVSKFTITSAAKQLFNVLNNNA